MDLFRTLILLYFCISCSNYSTSSRPLDLQDVYISSGVEQFFLTAPPHWMNFSNEAACFRKQSVRYLNYENIRKSYNLNYDQMLHLQQMFNRKIFAYRTSTGQEKLSPKDESFIFNNVYQQVLGNSYDFIVPKFKKISLVWIDPYLKDSKKMKEIFKRKDILSGHPILVSLCLTSYELEALAQKAGLEDLGVRYISADMESTFSSDIIKKPSFSIDFDELLKNKDLYFYGVNKLESLSSKVKFIKLN